MFWFEVISSEIPIKKKIIKVIVYEGIVVYIIYFIWVKRFVPDIAAAKLVVSDKGDNLSPK